MRHGRVYIVTTEGPALVQRLAVEEGLAEAELSAVCLNGTTTRLPITRAYTYFVRDHVRSLSGRTAYRLDLDRRVDGGNSWMLGAWIAHLLLAEGQLAMRDEPARVAVFATGEVAFSADAKRRAEIRAVEHVLDKVACLAGPAEEEAAAGRQIHLVVPKANGDEAKAALAQLPSPVRDRIVLHAVAEAADVRALLASGGVGGAVARRIRKARPWHRALVALGILAVIGAMLSVYFGWRSVEREWMELRRDGRYLDLVHSLDSFFLPVVAKHFRDSLSDEASVASPLAVSVAAHRPADGGDCAGLRLRESRTVRVDVQKAGAVHRLDEPRSLCGFSVESSSANKNGFIWILLRLTAGEGVREAVLPSWQLVTGTPKREPVLISQELPLYRDNSWAWNVITVWAPTESDEVTQLLGAHNENTDAASLAKLGDLGLIVARTRIELAQ